MPHFGFVVFSHVIAGLLIVTSVGAADRVALVIGNSEYNGELQLQNPVHDAVAIEGALKELQFTVLKKVNVNQDELDDALVDFRRMVQKGGLALFYYSGHGIEVGGKNYLVPVRARIREEYEVKRNCVEVGEVLDAMEESESKMKILILDCCRNNPLKRSWKRGVGKSGLAAIDELPQGTVIAYATAAGSTADDGEGEHSPYTNQLVSVLRSRPAGGLELKEIFFDTARRVKQETGQVPWVNMEASLAKYYLAVADPTDARRFPATISDAAPDVPVLVSDRDSNIRRGAAANPRKLFFMRPHSDEGSR